MLLQDGFLEVESPCGEYILLTVEKTAVEQSYTVSMCTILPWFWIYSQCKGSLGFFHILGGWSGVKGTQHSGILVIYTFDRNHIFLLYILYIQLTCWFIRLIVISTGWCTELEAVWQSIRTNHYKRYWNMCAGECVCTYMHTHSVCVCMCTYMQLMWKVLKKHTDPLCRERVCVCLFFPWPPLNPD